MLRFLNRNYLDYRLHIKTRIYQIVDSLNLRAETRNVLTVDLIDHFQNLEILDLSYLLRAVIDLPMVNQWMFYKINEDLEVDLLAQ